MKSQSGFSLVEVLVSLFLVSITGVAFTHAFLGSLKFNTLSEKRSGAISAAQQVLDELRTKDPFTLPTSGTTSNTINVGGRNFTVLVTYCSIGSYCSTPSIRTLSARVTYRNENLYAVDTIFTQLK